MSLSVDITKTMGAFTLRVCFQTQGETLALLGASGSGKSLTLKCIAGVEKPDSGRIVLNDRVLFDSEKRINLPPQKRRVGYLFQQYALFPNMTVAQNITAGAHAKPRAERRQTVAQFVRKLHLEGLEGRYPHQLSGGQQQRAALARILAGDPDILLLDEPFSALDSFLKWQLELELGELLREFKGEIIWVSHDRSEVRRNCDSVCVLSDGRSEPKQEISELFRAPQTMASCVLSGCKNFSRVQKLSDTRVRALDWNAEFTVPSVPDGVRMLGIRAYDIRPADRAGGNILRCRVDRVIEDVFSVVVMLTPIGGSGELGRIRFETDKKAWTSLSHSSELLLYMQPEAILLFRD